MASPLFDINKQKEQKLSAEFKSKYLNKHFEKLEQFARDLTRLPEPEECFFLQTENSFNAFTFIPLVTEKQAVKHLYASTYSISRRVINALIELHQEGLIDAITLLISDSLIKRNPVTVDNLIAVSAQYANIKIKFAWNHSKIALLQTSDNYYCIEGSGNWSENAHLEQYCFTNSKQVYEFRKRIFNETKIRYIADGGELRTN